MDDSALRSALKNLLAHGEAAKGRELTRMADAKKAPPPVAPAVCPECGGEMVDGTCSKCGYTEPADGADEGDLASLLESGAAEG